MKLCCKSEDLAFLGYGFPLYFTFKKSLIWLLAGLSILVGLPGIVLVNYSLVSKEVLEMKGNEMHMVIGIGSIFSGEIIA